MPRSPPPRMTSGAREPSCRPVTWAPIRCNGSTMRRIGRERSEASPVSTDRNGCAASSPESNRIEVPLLPASRMSDGSSSVGPLPTTVYSPGLLPSVISTPMPRRQAMVDITSSPLERPVTRAVPWAMALRMRERCEMDLSPGTASSPPSLAGLVMARTAAGAVIISAHPALYQCGRRLCLCRHGRSGAGLPTTCGPSASRPWPRRSWGFPGYCVPPGLRAL